MTTTVADQMVGILASVGVSRIYGLVGDSLNGFTDSLRWDGRIEWLHGRHEEVAAFAAGADAHLTGNIAVWAGSCGPGNLHLINGLFDCHPSGVAISAFVAQIPSAEVGSSYFQDTHPESLFRECSSYCETVGSASQMPRALDMAIRHAVIQHAVAVLVIPGDVALQPAVPGPASKPEGLLPATPIVQPPADAVGRLAAFLNQAGRVALLCGSGCAGAHEQVLALAAALRAPIVHSLRGKEHVEWENPYEVGMTGLVGFSSGYWAMDACDTLLMLGADFPYHQFYPAHARIAQIGLRGETIGRRVAVDLGVVSDVGPTLGTLLPHIQAKADRTHLDSDIAYYSDVRRGLDALATGRKRGVLHPQPDAESKLAEAFAYTGPVVVNAVVSRMELAMPHGHGPAGEGLHALHDARCA